MIKLEKLQEHIQSLKKDDWNKLFVLLPEIESTKKFGELKGCERQEDGSYTFPYWYTYEIVDRVHHIIHELKLIPVFDWSSWEEGQSILENQNFDYATLDSITLCKLLTTIVRADRFNDGFLVSNFENGAVPGIIKALKLNETNKNAPVLNQIKSVLFGVAVADALGVPVEFRSRQTIRNNPVTNMVGYGTYNLPAGTWSDDSSLTFCLAEALTQDFDLKLIGQYFVKWVDENYWTPRGNVFDIGMATKQAISRIATGVKPELAGGSDASSNGNGSLMRILPLLFYLQDRPINERFEITKQVSSITHGHIRSVIACFYYLEFARLLVSGKDKFSAYTDLQTEITSFLTSRSVSPTEIAVFDRLLKDEIYKLTEDKIKSSGYVLHTLEASIWCLLTTDSYKEAVLKAVNLGEDTDTTGAVTGGLAALLYGLNSIPKNWIKQIARKDDIENLAERLANKIASR
ncbi:ADP-ribosylglycohydrolase family protein [Mangrovibacterium sp.]|uniref:ADP-ribosylglycohydrolase family protein n=1 Tax=Mangrovibacterium sp. TaxID=1961364 RepID=UPI0035682020